LSLTFLVEAEIYAVTGRDARQTCCSKGFWIESDYDSNHESGHEYARNRLPSNINNRCVEAGIIPMNFSRCCSAMAVAAMLAGCNTFFYIQNGEEIPDKSYISPKSAEVVAGCLIDALESNFTSAGVEGAPAGTGYKITVKMEGTEGARSADVVLVINIRNIPSGSVSSFESKLTWKERRFVNILSDCQA
jgi:hypothetical protein